MKGCKFCPAYEKCSVTYRGSSCAAIRYSFGLKDDPEIVTNGDRIRGMSDEELVKYFGRATLCPNIDRGYCFSQKTCSLECVVGWLQKPAEEKK